MLVDSHCHLNYPDFSTDREEVINRARLMGIEVMLTINTRLSEAHEVIDIAESHHNIYASVGVHPHDASDHDHDTLNEDLLQYAQSPKVIAFGETGLDYYYENSPSSAQKQSFKCHIEAALEKDLPLIIHSRDADEDTIQILQEYGKGKVRGVFHCFSGSEWLATEALKLGFYISWSGIITFKNADDIRAIAATIPLDRVLVETDSPFLAPIPHRGRRNEPGFTRLVAERLADIKGLSLSEIETTTTKNFFDLFTKAERI